MPTRADVPAYDFGDFFVFRIVHFSAPKRVCKRAETIAPARLGLPTALHCGRRSPGGEASFRHLSAVAFGCPTLNTSGSRFRHRSLAAPFGGSLRRHNHFLSHVCCTSQRRRENAKKPYGRRQRRWLNFFEKYLRAKVTEELQATGNRTLPFTRGTSVFQRNRFSPPDRALLS